MFDPTNGDKDHRTDPRLVGLTYLVIDDSKFTRTLIKTALHGFGFRDVIEAPDAVDGLEVLRTTDVDVILVDYEMPLFNGIEFTRMARRDPETHGCELPIIMISGCYDKTKIIEARDAGIDEYLVKPFAPGDLYQRIAMSVLHPRPFVCSDTYIGPARRGIELEAGQAAAFDCVA